jgi:hypothetical protein
MPDREQIAAASRTARTALINMNQYFTAGNIPRAYASAVQARMACFQLQELFRPEVNFSQLNGDYFREE